MSNFSVNFAEKQVENIIKYSNRPNILIIINKNESSVKNEKLDEMIEKYSLKTVNMRKLDLAVLEGYLLTSC
jgi:hypothetical protein